MGPKRLLRGFCYISCVITALLTAIGTFAIFFVVHRTVLPNHESSSSDIGKQMLSLRTTASIDQRRDISRVDVNQGRPELAKGTFLGVDHTRLSAMTNVHKVAATTISNKSANTISQLFISNISTRLQVQDLVYCSSSTQQLYATLPSASESDSQRQWCTTAEKQYRVVVGRSWGSLTKAGQNSWEEKRCNEHLSAGKALSCAQKWGWAWLQEWSNAKHLVVSQKTKVSCMVDPVRTSTYCEVKHFA